MAEQSSQNLELRIKVVFVIFAMACLAVVIKLFYLQVIKHNYYQSQATVSQFRDYQIPAERGQILARSGGEFLPIALNERTYKIVVDPTLIDDDNQTSEVLSQILKMPKDQILKLVSDKKFRYKIIAKNVNTDQKNAVVKAMEEGKIQATFAETTSRRIYPQGNLAATVLGFVDDQGVGKYGLEQAVNQQLYGTPGRVKALTDKNGIPLLATGDNISKQPEDGLDVVTTLDLTLQRKVEELVKKRVKVSKSDFGDAVVLEISTGKIKAMASYPSYNLSEFNKVKDPSKFLNSAVARPLEPGSVMKTLTVAAALNEGVVEDGQTYYDPSYYKVDDFTIRNVVEDGGAAMRSVEDILKYSLNTGATWLLMQMGGGQINQQARQTWHNYMVNKYHFGSKTGVEQGFEEPGLVPDPNNGYALNLKYANSVFGQGMTVTPLQMAAALSAALNGGKYYQPTLVEGFRDSDGIFKPNQPKIINDDVVSPEVSKILAKYMVTTLSRSYTANPSLREGFLIGGKTGTAEVANPAGGYYKDRNNGTYIGFVGIKSPEYIIMSRMNHPRIAGYVGSTAAAPLFVDIAAVLTDQLGVLDGR